MIECIVFTSLANTTKDLRDGQVTQCQSNAFDWTKTTFPDQTY